MDDNNTKKLELTFAPGCFDNFEGTQEELDEIIAEIQRLADSGELLENSQEIDPDSDEYRQLLDSKDVRKILN